MNSKEKRILKGLLAGRRCTKERSERHAWWWQEAFPQAEYVWYMPKPQDRYQMSGWNAFTDETVSGMIDKGWITLRNNELFITPLGAAAEKKTRRKKFGTIPKRFRDDSIV